MISLKVQLLNLRNIISALLVNAEVASAPEEPNIGQPHRVTTHQAVMATALRLVLSRFSYSSQGPILTKF